MPLQHLNPGAISLLRVLSKQDYISKFVLVGGSAMAFHLGHRRSEDLDFFTGEGDFRPRTIDQWIKRLFPGASQLLAESTKLNCLVGETKLTFYDLFVTMQDICSLSCVIELAKSNFTDFNPRFFLGQILYLDDIPPDDTIWEPKYPMSREDFRGFFVQRVQKYTLSLQLAPKAPEPSHSQPDADGTPKHRFSIQPALR